MNEEHFAILVGISRYAAQELQPLSGPLNDVDLLHGWLTLPEGGGVPAENVVRIVSDEGAASARPADDYPPVFNDFMNAFVWIVRNPAGGWRRRPRGRLYLYLSGHGFCARRASHTHAALHVANASRELTWNIYGTYFAQWARDHGLFGEVVLVMDCCRDAEILTEPMVPPLRLPSDVEAPQGVKLLEVYAAPRGGKAQERPIPTRGGQVHGLLTHVLVEALEHAAHGHKTVSGSDLKGYFEERWKDVCGSQPADPPQVILPPVGDIVFGRPPPAPLAQRFRLSRLQPGSRVEILGADLEVAFTLAIGSEAVQVTRQGESVEVPVTDRTFIVDLPVTFYRAVASSAGETVSVRFQPGGDDVTL
jgi:hypothetical protein